MTQFVFAYLFVPGTLSISSSVCNMWFLHRLCFLLTWAMKSICDSGCHSSCPGSKSASHFSCEISVCLVVASLLPTSRRGIFKHLGRKSHFLLTFRFENKLIFSTMTWHLPCGITDGFFGFGLKHTFLTTLYAVRCSQMFHVSSSKNKSKTMYLILVEYQSLVGWHIVSYTY